MPSVSRRAWLRALIAAPALAPLLARCGGASPSIEPARDARSLLARLPLADVDHNGPFVELGSVAKDRHVLGGWRTGWGEDLVSHGEPRTEAASPALVFLEVPAEPGPYELRAELAVGGAARVSLHAGGDVLIERALSPGATTLRAPLAGAPAGPLVLELRHDAAPGAVAVGWLHLARPGATGAPPRLAELSDGDALLLRPPTRLAFPIDVDRPTRLEGAARLDAGPGATLRVLQQAADAPRPRLLFEGELTGADLALSVALAPSGPSRVILAVNGEPAARVRIEAPRLTTPRPAPAPRPRRAERVLVVLCDTLRADRLRAYAPRTRVHAPALEALAREATVFERCVTPANWTKPAVASLFTGRTPARHGALTANDPLPAVLPTLAEALREGGLATAAFVANGFVSGELGFARGFDRFESTFDEAPRNRAAHLLEQARRRGLAQGRGRAFVYVHGIEPHVPYDPEARDLLRYDPEPYEGPLAGPVPGERLEAIRAGTVRLGARDRRRLEALYDAEVTGFDRALGRFLDALRASGWLDDALVVFVSDHGEELLDHGSVGHGHSMQEELLHVPLLVRAPGVPPGRAGGLATLMDLAPTVLTLAGAPALEGADGRSLVGELGGGAPAADRAAFASQWDVGGTDELKWSARVGDLKLWTVGARELHVHDLASDPRERRALGSAVARRILEAELGAHVGALARAGRARARAAPLSEPLREHLRALGYVAE